MTARLAAPVLVAVLLGVAACTSAGPPTSQSSTVVTGTTTETVTQTVAASGAGVAPASTVAPLPADGSIPAGEVQQSCPYIKAGLNSEPTDDPNVADIEGDRVGVVTVLKNHNPVGCRFYFGYSLAGQHEAVADILPYTFGTALEARNAMIRTATAGSGAQTITNFVDGLTGIRYQTQFYGPDGGRDWAFVFAKGTRVVVVHTQQTNASINAQLLAAAVAAKF